MISVSTGLSAGSSRSSFRSSSVLTPKTSDSFRIRFMSGTDCAPSHLETDWRLTPSISASSSCDQPFFFLSSMILSARIIFSSFPMMHGALPCAVLNFRRIASGHHHYTVMCDFCVQITEFCACMPSSGLGNRATGGCKPLRTGRFSFPPAYSCRILSVWL